MERKRDGSWIAARKLCYLVFKKAKHLFSIDPFAPVNLGKTYVDLPAEPVSFAQQYQGFMENLVLSGIIAGQEEVSDHGFKLRGDF